MSYRNFQTEDRRLVILRLLAEAQGRASNCRLLQKGLAPIGHKVSLDQVKTDVSWLEEQGLVTVEEFSPDKSRDYMVATLTQRGADVANGNTTVPGVSEPSY